MKPAAPLRPRMELFGSLVQEQPFFREAFGVIRGDASGTREQRPLRNGQVTPQVEILPHGINCNGCIYCN